MPWRCGFEARSVHQTREGQEMVNKCILAVAMVFVAVAVYAVAAEITAGGLAFFLDDDTIEALVELFALLRKS